MNNEEFEVTSPPDWWPDAPENHLSPYTLLLGASASCFSLSVFQAAGRLHTFFSNVEVESTGKMNENEQGIWSFDSIELKVKVTIEDETQRDKIVRAIEMAHKTCPVANSLKCPTLLDYEVVIA
ncbi:MAG: OsmC family protein [Candidatus Thorarchaeota archaeon]